MSMASSNLANQGWSLEFFAGFSLRVVFLRIVLNLAKDTAISGANVPEYLFFLAHVSASR